MDPSELQDTADRENSSFVCEEDASVGISNGEGLSINLSEHQVQGAPEPLEVQEVKQSKSIDSPNEQNKDHGQVPASEINLVEEVADAKKQTGSGELVKELRESLLNAEERVKNLTAKLVEVQKEMEEEIKARDKKYSDLDMKFGKLQKRAKQRIQELQKERDDFEAQVAAASEKASQAANQCSSLQHDLERVRAQAGDALRSLDAERQQLRASQNKQKEVIEELSRRLESKEKEQKEAQRITAEKDQLISELTEKMLEMEEKHNASVAELVTKHQKVVEDLEAQVVDAVQERTKAAETISSLQNQLARKETQIAELDAASSGEAIRLTAALEALRGDLGRMEQEHRKEQKTWEATVASLKLKLEENEKARVQQEIMAVKGRSQMESELRGVRQALAVAEAELAAKKDQISGLEKEFNAYKVRAYSLLQKKEAELTAAKDVEQLARQEAALKEAQRVAASAVAERDRVLKALKDVKEEHESQLAARSVALLDAEQRIRELATKLESTKTQMLVEQEAWQSRVNDINANWQEKYNSLKGKDTFSERLEKELGLLKDSYSHLKEEHDAFRDMANSMVESKDQEIAQLLGEIRELQKVISDASTKASGEANSKTAPELEDNLFSSIEGAEQQIVLLARQQAQREEELAQCQRHIQALQDEIVELEHENRLHSQQESALKEELRNLERSKKRDGVDMTYLKNVILKLLETGEVEALLPVIAMLLQFSPDELRKCQEVYSVTPETPVPAADTPRTLLSRFMFSTVSR